MTDALADWQKAQEAEWLVYVAAGVIELDGVRAFNPGDPVPVSHVTRGIVRTDQVLPAAEKATAVEQAEQAPRNLAFEPPSSVPRGTLDQPEPDAAPTKRSKAGAGE